MERSSRFDCNLFHGCPFCNLLPNIGVREVCETNRHIERFGQFKFENFRASFHERKFRKLARLFRVKMKLLIHAINDFSIDLLFSSPKIHSKIIYRKEMIRLMKDPKYNDMAFVWVTEMALLHVMTSQYLAADGELSLMRLAREPLCKYNISIFSPLLSF